MSNLAALQDRLEMFCEAGRNLQLDPLVTKEDLERLSRLAGNADIALLRTEFPELLTIVVARREVSFMSLLLHN